MQAVNTVLLAAFVFLALRLALRSRAPGEDGLGHFPPAARATPPPPRHGGPPR